MQWEEHENGYLAKAEHGFFYVYEESGRWFVEYDPGSQSYGDEESMPLNLRGFTTFEEAKNAAEEYLEDIEIEDPDFEIPEEEY
jgi:hypothetical protein